LTRKQAEQRLRVLMTSVRATRSSAAVSVPGLATQYIEHVTATGRKRSTLQDYEWISKKHFASFFGDRTAARVDASLLRSYVESKRAAGLSAKTIRNHLALLNAMFAFGVRREVLDDNPVQRVERPRDEVVDAGIKHLTIGELRAVVAACEDEVFARLDQAIVLTAAMTGLRQGELLGLHWRDIDHRVNLIRVRRAYTRGAWTSPKSRRGVRAVPLPLEVSTKLQGHRLRSVFSADDDLVFAHPHTGHVLDASRLRRRFKRALERAGVRAIRFHDLRHTYGTLMAAAGTPMRLLQEWMGHQDYKTTLIYADYAPDPAQGVHFTHLAFGDGTADRS
jgi:integrase